MLVTECTEGLFTVLTRTFMIHMHFISLKFNSIIKLLLNKLKTSVHNITIHVLLFL